MATINELDAAIRSVLSAVRHNQNGFPYEWNPIYSQDNPEKLVMQIVLDIMLDARRRAGACWFCNEKATACWNCINDSVCGCNRVWVEMKCDSSKGFSFSPKHYCHNCGRALRGEKEERE